MIKYFLDSGFFIQSHRGPYSIDIMPGFWDWVDEEVANGRLVSSSMVFDELIDGKDWLADWAKARKGEPLFQTPSLDAQANLVDLSDYVITKYPKRHADVFLAKADPWVIAQAIAQQGKVITMEKIVASNSKKVKIPNICNEFDVEWLNTYDMMRELGAKINNRY